MSEAAPVDKDRVYIFDTTLRDGAQTNGVDFSVADKLAICQDLDRLGVDYIEAGWPGANPVDSTFFESPPALDVARLTAFGMTKRVGRSVSNDPGFNALLQAPVNQVCIFGKTWDFHVEVALRTTNEENLAAIRDSVAALAERKAEALFDAEHFFDGYKANPDYALACVQAAYEAGARWVVLCDTNGGTLPEEITRIVGEVARHVPGTHLGIHTHNDTDNAVANSLAAVDAGARMVQGTLNGLGERCGNANLSAVIPNLVLKKGIATNIDATRLSYLTPVVRSLDERLNRAPSVQAPYVGTGAFAHKGGVHASAVAKNPRSYEHVDPAEVGNERQIVVSDQAGRANLLARLKEIGVEIDPKDPRITDLVEAVKQREYAGFTYDGAGASFALLAREALGEVPEYYRVLRFRAIDERRWNAKEELVTYSEATIELDVGGRHLMTAAHGNGPVNALDTAMRKVLTDLYPALEEMRLTDYKVRILTPSDGSGAVTRVMVESADAGGQRWTTVGVSPNIIDASFNALSDSLRYKLFSAGVTPPARLDRSETELEADETAEDTGDADDVIPAE